jgi:hypothetical protein
MKAGVFVCLMFCLSLSLSAGTIVYSDQVLASGSLGSQPFTNALVIFTVVGDTGNVGSSPPYRYNTGPLTVSVAGIGVAAFTGTDTFGVVLDTSNNPTKVGVGDFAQDSGGLNTESAALASYYLRGAIGPVSGSMYFGGTFTDSTTLGTLTVTSISGNSTFQATRAPEPASLIPFGLGMAMIAGCRRLRRRATA